MTGLLDTNVALYLLGGQLAELSRKVACASYFFLR